MTSKNESRRWTPCFLPRSWRCASPSRCRSGDDGKRAATAAAATVEVRLGGGGPVKVAILSDCEGAFGAFYEPDIAGAQVPLINRGAKVKNPKKPSDGITGAKLGGKDVEIVGYGCSDDTADKAVEETRRLMEQEDADILIGPLSGDESIAVANYAKEHPDKTFINGAAGAQDASLKVQAPNFFRYNTDGAHSRLVGRVRLRGARLAHGSGDR